VSDICDIIMKAVVYESPMHVAVADVPRPKLQNPRDAIVRLTSSAICGSDLHMYEGHTEMKPGRVVGHEPMGVIEEVGEAVRTLKPGDRVVMPFNVACGVCMNCVRGYTNACLTLNREKAGAGYGYVGLGPYEGAQAEFLHVPFADWACLKLPGTPGDQFEDDFVLLADIFPTAYYSTEMANVTAGKSVAIFGAGPVGLLAAYSSLLKGAAQVFVVDKAKRRLDMAKSIGAIPINFLDGDPVEQIKTMRLENKLLMDSFRPGEEKMAGVDCAIDAVGYQAYDRSDPSKYKANQVLMDIARVVNPTGALGIIGVYLESDPRAPNEAEKAGYLMLPWGEIWSKGLTVKNGQTPVKEFHIFLRNLIIAGRAKPGFIVTDRINIEDAPRAYKEFDKREDLVKAVIKFPMHGA
jgi:glutathione-independent formaldehyde dehydrogenase